jgi:hypothetical protein
MIVIMKPGATAAEIGAVIRKAESMGAKTHPIYGDNRTVVALVGDLTRVNRETFDADGGVLHTMRIQEPYKLSSRTTRPDNTVIDWRNGRVRSAARDCGDGRPVQRGEPRPDHRDRPRHQGCRRHRAARRRLQAAHQPLRFPGAGAEGAGVPGRRA